jgi:hypothetical protein
MMEYGRLLVALALTWLPGCVWLMRIVPRDMPGRSCLVAGYALLAGLIVIPIIMRGLSVIGIPFSFFSIGLPAALLMLAGLLLPAKWRLYVPGQAVPPPRSSYNRWEMVVICVCLALIASRLVTLGLEVVLRPIFAWDGKQHWAKQAKIFFDAGSIVQYVPFQQWLELGGKNVYTTVHPDYPNTVPLLQVWTSIALGEWHESLLNLPWVLCYISLGLIFFGQVRAANASTAVAVAVTYMLLSVPYLNIQVALAGYADIFMATCYLAAVAAFFNWSISKNNGQALLALFFAMSCLLIKNEGFFWLLSFVPGILLVLLGIKRGIFAILGLAFLLLVFLWLLPGDVSVAGQSLEALNLDYRSKAWLPISRSFLVHDNWHLLGYISIAVILLIAFFATSSLPRVAPLAAIVASAFCLFLALYLLTDHARGAAGYTSINRVALQLIPAVGFLTAICYLQLCRSKTSY